MHNENSFIPNSQETVIAFRHNYLTIALDPHQTCAGNVRHRFKLLSCLPQYRSIAILLDSLNVRKHLTTKSQNRRHEKDISAIIYQKIAIRTITFPKFPTLPNNFYPVL